MAGEQDDKLPEPLTIEGLLRHFESPPPTQDESQEDRRHGDTRHTDDPEQ
jgi:hypothetical protein